MELGVKWGPGVGVWPRGLKQRMVLGRLLNRMTCETPAMLGAPRNRLSGAEPELRRTMHDGRYLHDLEQLRTGKRSDGVRLAHRDGTRMDVWFAHEGQFVPGPGNRWTYIDELGKNWGPVEHNRVSRSHGRLPYGHIAYDEYPSNNSQRVPDGYRTLRAPADEPLDPMTMPVTEIRYVRMPLRQAVFDDNPRHPRGIDLGRVSPEQALEIANGREPALPQPGRPSQRATPQQQAPRTPKQPARKPQQTRSSSSNRSSQPDRSER